MQEAFTQGAIEALMRNYRGELAECSQANFFIVRSGEVFTPPLDAGLLEGVTRNFMFEVGAASGVSVREAILWEHDLTTADEAFMTSTTREVVPIIRVGEHVIGKGCAGSGHQAAEGRANAQSQRSDSCQLVLRGSCLVRYLVPGALCDVEARTKSPSFVRPLIPSGRSRLATTRDTPREERGTGDEALGSVGFP